MRQIKMVIFAMFLLLVALPRASVFAQGTPRTIRVGCIDLHNFIERQKNGEVDGYGAAYLKEIAKYTNWRYEYVSGNWAECLEWLREGKIDLLLPAECDPARENDFLYSRYSVCTDYAAMFTRKDNDVMFYQDYASFNNIKIGLIRENLLNQKFMHFAERNHFSPRYIYFDNLKELTRALEDGTVDAIVNGNLNVAPQQKLLAKFEVMPAYFIMSKSNAGLMEELDRAIYQILLDNPYFVAMLNEKFYAGDFFHAKGLTREENAYVHAVEPFKVICMDARYPYSWYDNKKKQFEGIYPDILRLISRQTGLKFTFTAAGEAENTNLSAESTALFLSYYDSASSLRKDSITCTVPYTVETYSLLNSRSSDFDAEKAYTATLLRGDINLQNYLRKYYPQWKVLLCDDEKKCLTNILAKKSDLAILDSARLQTTTLLARYPTIGVIPTLSLEVPISIAASSNQNHLLFSILDKAIQQMNKKEVNQIVLKNTFISPPRITVYYLFQYYLWEVLSCAIVIFLLLSAGLVFLYRERVKTRQNVLLAIKNNELTEVVMLAQHAGRAYDLYEGLYNAVPFGIVQYEFYEEGKKLNLLYANKGAQVILNSSEPLHGNFFEGVQESTIQNICEVAAALQKVGERCPFEETFTMEGNSVWISGTAELLAWEAGKKIVQSTFMDTTQQKKLEKELQRRSQTDALTNILNKAAAELCCSAYIEGARNGEPMALLAIDIDHFKRINDSCGHRYGDEMLCKFAEALRQTFCADDIIGRIGGDEFIVLLKGTADSGLIADKARRLCRLANELSDVAALPFSCSIGIAVQNGGAVSYEDLFARADRALYQTKNKGRNSWTFG